MNLIFGFNGPTNTIEEARWDQKFSCPNIIFDPRFDLIRDVFTFTMRK